MAIDFRLTPEQLRQVNKFVKPQTGPGQLVNPKEKIGEQIPKDFNARGQVS